MPYSIMCVMVDTILRKKMKVGRPKTEEGRRKTKDKTRSSFP